MTPEPFTIAVPDADVDDLRRRLAATRLADDFANDDWGYGTERGYLQELIGSWADGYDWRAAESAMNRLPNYRVTLDGVPIHFVHRRGRDGAVPLILTHGWPWTWWDMHLLIDELGDDFHLVVPSLPGFGFSSPLRVDGIGPPETVDLWARLMTDVLGYERFAAAGGDYGAIISIQLGHKYADRLIGVHTTLPYMPGVNVREIDPADVGPGEEHYAEQMATRLLTATSHVVVHRTDPQTLAYALNDSPAGLASWIVERRRAWSGSGGDVESVFPRDHLLTVFSIYWFTQTIGTSMRYYRHHFGPDWQPSHDRTPLVEAPTAIAVFPDELILMPRRTAERYCNLQQWTVMPAGGHFAHYEQPRLVADDLRKFLL